MTLFRKLSTSYKDQKMGTSSQNTTAETYFLAAANTKHMNEKCSEVRVSAVELLVVVSKNEVEGNGTNGEECHMKCAEQGGEKGHRKDADGKNPIKQWVFPTQEYTRYRFRVEHWCGSNNLRVWTEVGCLCFDFQFVPRSPHVLVMVVACMWRFLQFLLLWSQSAMDQPWALKTALANPQCNGGRKHVTARSR